MRKLFWAGLHLSTLILLISGFCSYFRTPDTKSLTAVESAVSFSVDSGLPNSNDILQKVNNLRSSSNLKPINGDSQLTKIAEQRADDMVKRSYYGHLDPDGNYFDDLMGDQGVNAAYACENLSLETVADAEVVFRSWQESQTGHFDCMVDKRVSKAGYASRLLFSELVNGQLVNHYLVVAIHAS